MTGGLVHPLDLHPHDIIHLEPHLAAGHPVTRRPLDVEVEDAHEVPEDHLLVAVDWREHAGFPGASPTTAGVTVYDRCGWVLRIGGTP